MKILISICTQCGSYMAAEAYYLIPAMYGGSRFMDRFHGIYDMLEWRIFKFSKPVKSLLSLPLNM